LSGGENESYVSLSHWSVISKSYFLTSLRVESTPVLEDWSGH
jgi:hypothetical protein